MNDQCLCLMETSQIGWCKMGALAVNRLKFQEQQKQYY